MTSSSPPEAEIVERLASWASIYDASAPALGAMLRDNALVHQMMQIVRPASFYKYAHQLIYDCIIELVVAKAGVADPVTLANLLQERGSVEDVGGYGYIAEVWESAGALHVAEHAQIVRGHAIKRAISVIGGEIRELAMEAGADWKVVLDEAEKKLFAVSKKVRSATTEHFATKVQEMLERMDQRKNRNAENLLMSGWTRLDKITEGIDEGNLVVIGARTGVGKTVVALNLAFNFAEEGHPVFIVSLEQPGVELAERVVAGRSNVEAFLIRKAIIEPSREAEFFRAVEDIKATPVWISDTPTQTILDITASIRQASHLHGIKAAFIDYLQLVTPEDRTMKRHEQIAEMTRMLKLVARETGVRVFLLAQINRESEKSGDKRPQLHQLRESGSIEQDIDVAFLLYCESQTTNQMEIIVAKNRHGICGTAHVHFDRRRLKIMDPV